MNGVSEVRTISRDTSQVNNEPRKASDQAQGSYYSGATTSEGFVDDFELDVPSFLRNVN